MLGHTKEVHGNIAFVEIEGFNPKGKLSFSVPLYDGVASLDDAFNFTADVVNVKNLEFNRSTSLQDIVDFFTEVVSQLKSMKAPEIEVNAAGMIFYAESTGDPSERNFGIRTELLIQNNEDTRKIATFGFIFRVDIVAMFTDFLKLFEQAQEYIDSLEAI